MLEITAIHIPLPNTPKRLFPLHLTPFENYMLVDDSAAYPMTFVVQLEFSGKLDRGAFEKAVGQALPRHPLLCCVVQPAKQDRDCWVLPNDVALRVDWGDLNTPLAFVDGEFLDLRREIGVRIWVRHDEERAVVTTQFHHSVCDGIGSYQFLGDVLYFYAENVGAPIGQPLPPLDPIVLRSRLRATFPAHKFMDETGKFRKEWKETAELLLGRTSKLAIPKIRSSAEGSVPFPSIRSHVFDRQAYRELRLRAQENSQTPNDYLLEKLFLSIQTWNIEKSLIRLPQSICVLMPMDLREPDGIRFSAANIVTYTFIRRSGKRLHDRDLLVKSLREELAMLKRDRHGTRFMNMIAGSFHYPGLLRTILRGKCLATVVMSNTGDPTRHFLVPFPRDKGVVCCGNLRLENVSGVPPIRNNMRAAISAFTYRRVLRLCVRTDPRQCTPDVSQQFLNNYVAHLQA